MDFKSSFQFKIINRMKRNKGLKLNVTSRINADFSVIYRKEIDKLSCNLAERLGDPDAGLYFWFTDIYSILYTAVGVRVTISRAKSIVLPQNLTNADSSVKCTVDIARAQQCILHSTNYCNLCTVSSTR